SRKAFDSIGAITELRWLDMDRITISDKDLDGKSIASLSNLKNLHLLRVSRFVGATPLLAQLAKGSPQLRRLCVWPKTPLTSQDAELISRLKTLDSLVLSYCDELPLNKCFDSFAKLPNLQRLELDHPMVGKDMAGSGARLSHLKMLVLKCVPDG